jgi:hypothetical protein
MTTTYQLSTKSATYLQGWESIAFEDLNKSGYQNFGQANDFISKNLAANTTTYINAQGGNDTVYLIGSGNSVVYGGQARITSTGPTAWTSCTADRATTACTAARATTS